MVLGVDMVARSQRQPQQCDFTFDLKNPEHMIMLLRQFMVNAGGPLPNSYIHKADPYSAPPADLLRGRHHAPGTQAWYLLNSRQSPPGGSTANRDCKVRGCDGEVCGFWRSDKVKKPVLDADRRTVGYSRTLYYRGKTETTTSFQLIGWSMVEFWLEQQNGAGQQLLLCKVYETNPKKYRAEAAPEAAEESGASLGGSLDVPMTRTGAEAAPVAQRAPLSEDDNQMSFRGAGAEAATEEAPDRESPVVVLPSMANTATNLLLLAAEKAMNYDIEKACEIHEFVVVKELYLGTIDELGLKRWLISRTR